MTQPGPSEETHLVEVESIAPDPARELIDNLPVAVYRTTPNGRILEGNPAIKSLLGYTVEEFTALAANDLYFDSKDRTPFMQSRMEEYDVVRTVLRLKRKDGSAVWTEDVGRAIKDEGGQVLYFDGILVDITDQVETEQAMRDQESSLRTLHEKAPIAIFTLGPDGRVMEANPQAHRMLGLEDGGLIGKTISEFTDDEDAKESHEAFQRIRSGELDEVSLDKRYRRADDTSIWGHVRAVAVRGEQGEFLHTISLVQDITERHRSEEALRLVDEIIQQINESDDLDGAIQAIIDGVCQTLGFGYGEAWLPDAEGALRLSPAWRGPHNMPTMKLRRISDQMALSPGEGLPGLALQSDEPVAVEDLSHDIKFVRAGAAAAAGLHSAVAVPVRSHDRVVCVLMFMDNQRSAPDSNSVRLLRFLADRLGSTVSRRRLELRLAEQAAIMEAQIEGVAEGILVTSAEGEIMMVNKRLLLICGVECDLDDDSCRSMDLFRVARSQEGFIDRVAQLYEDRTDGQGCVEVEDVSYRRRFVDLPHGGGKVWYFARADGAVIE